MVSWSVTDAKLDRRSITCDASEVGAERLRASTAPEAGALVAVSARTRGKAVPRNGGRGSAGEAARRAARRVAAAPATRVEAVNPEEIFARLRHGARNVAGVTYQVGLSAAMLARSGAEGWPDVNAVRPEGFEDIDGRLADGSWLFVQSKERSPGNPLGASGVADAIAHALELRRIQSEIPLRIAIVTNEPYASNVPVTGWSASLAGQENLENIRSALSSRGMSSQEIDDALAIASTVLVPSPLKPGIVQGLLSAYGAAAAVAVTAHAHLVHELGEMAGGQRSRRLDDALVFERARLDRLIEDVQRATDLRRLSRAVDSGVCEFADFSAESPDDSAMFFSGVAVLPSHIASGLDVIRITETELTLEALKQSRQALIVGPSGTGKSALLWRTASMIADGSRVIRVTRVSSDDDVVLLVDHVAALAPESTRPVLVCIDDLGRARTAAWPAARDELLAMAGVSVLGGCRQEDLTPELARRAALVDSRLMADSAQSVIRTLQASGIDVVVEPEEAIERGDGLLMEMIAFATTGHHLRQVLEEQVASLSERDPLAIEALRYIVTLHTLGHALPAEQLAPMCAHGDLSRSLQILRDEHLIAVEDATAWRALHDLRAEVLVEVLHGSPPPTLGATYARAISGVEPRLRPELTRRAAIRLARRSTSMLGLTREFAALADLVREQVRQGTERLDRTTASWIAEWVQVAERLDALTYVHVALPLVSSSVPETADPADFLLMAYSQQQSNLFANTNMFQLVRDLALRLPQWSSISVDAVLAALEPNVVSMALVEGDLESAVALLEAIEGRVAVSAADVARVLETHPVDAGSLRSVGLRAQLVAALFSANNPEPAVVDDLFGPVADRVELAVAADPSAYEAAVETIAASALPDSPSALARPPRSDLARVATARAFARAEHLDERDPYPDQPGTDPSSINAQAVRLVRRLFDMCPELDLVTVDIVQADGGTSMMGVPTDGHKQIRAGVIPRAVEQRRNIAVQTATMSMRNHERWSDRCRQQAALAGELSALLDELPRRLAANDNAGRRRMWSDRVRRVAAEAARMPGIPARRPFLDEAAALLGTNAADLEVRIKESDKARKFYDAVTGSLYQIVRSEFEQNATHGAGLRLADTLKVFDEAVAQPQLPIYSALGPTLPNALRDSVQIASRLLTSFENVPPVSLQVTQINADDLTKALGDLAAAQAATTTNAIVARLAAAGVTDLSAVTYEATDPVPAWNHLGVGIAVAIDDWAATERALREWEPDARAASGFDSRVVASIRDGELAIPIGVVLFGPGSRGVPATEEYLRIVQVAHGLQEISRVYRARMGAYLDQLVSISQDKNLLLHRPSGWPELLTPQPLPERLTIEVGDPASWRSAVEKATDLAIEVQADDAQGAQLAVDLSRIDLGQVNPAAARLAEMLSEAGLFALQADMDTSQAG
ncbi:MAG: hypothetical protein JWR04_1303 [Rhodoglobus sp.]|nr:hypothetical protein [Rhodoglobus sp.]